VRDRGLLVAGVLLVAVSMIGPAVQGGAAGPDGWWPGHMFGPGHMNWWTTESNPPIEGAQELVVTATDFGFSPTEVIVPLGEPVNLTLVNQGAVFHDLTVAELGVRVVAAPGQSTTVGVLADRAGTFDMVCSYPGHADLGMTGLMVVR